MIDHILDNPVPTWLVLSEDAPSIVLSTRVRLARNFKHILFPNRGDDNSLREVEEMMRHVLPALHKRDGRTFSNIRMDQLSEIERAILVEKHLISPVFADLGPHRSLLVSDDAAIAIMVNEEDHIRIQSMMPGLALEAALGEALKIDDAIESTLDYAFNERFGYVTACPTNVGTGLRASVMLHLPALVMTNRINRIVRGIVQLGFSVRGLYGEGSDTVGNIFQVSNQVTMGISEEDTLEQLGKVVTQLIKEEEGCRSQLLKEDKLGLEDRIWRSYGVATNARRISSEEALPYISDIQLGYDVGILGPRKHILSELVICTRPNFLQKYISKEEVNPQERDVYRAQVLRERLCSNTVSKK